MYCIQCGVKLADTENKCPLCGTVPYHPTIRRTEAIPLYPRNRYPAIRINRWGALITATTAFLLPLLITLLCDLRINGHVTWSGYSMGALAVLYILTVLPFWFKAPNPVIFVPCDFAAALLYLLYINLASGGHWFMPFAFPTVGFLCLLVTALVTLLRYTRRGRLYIFGGAAVLLGAFMPLMELLLNITFARPHYAAWSIYPMTALVLLGGMLIFLAICRPARETMEQKFFL